MSMTQCFLTNNLIDTDFDSECYYIDFPDGSSIRSMMPLCEQEREKERTFDECIKLIRKYETQTFGKVLDEWEYNEAPEQVLRGS